MPGQLQGNVLQSAAPEEWPNLIAGACSADLTAILNDAHLAVEVYRLARLELARRAEESNRETLDLARTAAKDSKRAIKLMKITMWVSIAGVILAAIALLK